MIGNIFAQKPFSFGESKTWAESAAVTAVEQSVAVPGVKVGDIVLVQKPTHQSGLAVGGVARCDADGTLKVMFINPTAGALTATAEESYTGCILRPELPLQPNATV